MSHRKTQQISSVMEELLSAQNETTLKGLKEHAIVKGRIIEIHPTRGVIVDIGGKSEGNIPANEFIDTDDLHPGNEIEVYIERLEDMNGTPVLSYDKARQQKSWGEISAQNKEGCILPARVKGKVKGGLIMSVSGVDAFLPSSQIDVQAPKEDLGQYLGKTFDVKIIKVDEKRKNIVVSRREIIEEERTRKRREILQDVKPGDIRRGLVKNVTDYGVFVDLDGLDGLLYITDMTWGRISHPNEMVKVGEEIETMIIEVDRERERVSLGLKQMKQNPWENIQARLPIGTTVKGKVVNLVPYGAFIEFENGLEGLIHITEFSWTKRINKPSEVLKIGQEVEAAVIDIKPEEQKISLSLRHLEENPWEMVRHNYPVGAHVRGIVRNFTNYGAFVELAEGIDGMVHVSDMSWTRKINHPSELLEKGQEIDAVVLEVDTAQQRIALGIKQLQTDPWSNIEQIFKIGDIVSGKVAKVTNYGAFIALKHDIDGLVHISQISEDHVENTKDILKVDQEVSARVIKIDHASHRIGLSIKAANYSDQELAEEIKTLERLNSTEKDFSNLGNLLDQAILDQK